MKGFLSHGTGNLYSDRDGVVECTNEKEKDAVLLLRKLKSAIRKGTSEPCLDGVFSKLLDPNEFQKAVFPGVKPQYLKNAPKDLKVRNVNVLIFLLQYFERPTVGIVRE